MYMCSADPSPTYSVLRNNRLINTVYISVYIYIRTVIIRGVPKMGRSPEGLVYNGQWKIPI